MSSGNGPTRRLDTDGAGSSNSAPSDRKLSPKKKKKKKKKSDTSEEIHQSELEQTKVCLLIRVQNLKDSVQIPLLYSGVVMANFFIGLSKIFNKQKSLGLSYNFLGVFFQLDFHCTRVPIYQTITY